MEDVVSRDSCTGAACRDSAQSEAGGNDGSVDMDGSSSMEGGSGDDGGSMDGSMMGSDASDAQTSEVGVVVGRCTGVMASPLELGSEPRQQARRAFVAQSAAVYFVGYPLQVGGGDSVVFQRISTTGASLGMTNVVAALPVARTVGGAFAVTPTGFASVFASNYEMGLDIYMQRLDAMGATTGSTIRVAQDDELSEDPQVVRTSAGEVVVWRSTNDMLGGTRLLSSLVNGSTAGAANNVGPMMTQASSFDMVTDGTRIAVALVARNSLGQGNVFLQVLDANGALQNSVQLTTGAFVSEAVSVALMGTDAVVSWTARNADGTFRLRRVNLDTGMAGPEMVIAGFGFDVSQASIAPDRDGLVAAMRTTTPMGARVAVGRIGPSLMLREGLSAIAPSGPGDQVRIVARGDGTFGVAWADETPMPMNTTVKFQLVRCP
jgi:Fe2+ transport system protein FeoA